MTLHSERFNQTYHSRHGAVTESLHVFLNAGWHHQVTGLSSSDTIRVLELGLGTGLNALLTLKAWQGLTQDKQPKLDYVALEPFPLSAKEREGLEMQQVIDGATESDIHLHPDKDQHKVDWAPNARFYKGSVHLARPQARQVSGAF